MELNGIKTNTNKLRANDKVSQAQLVVSILSSKWTVRVLYTLSDSTKRYSELHGEIPGITEKALTDTLKRLERYGLLRRKLYPVIPPRVEYRLTIDGLDLLKIVDDMALWTASHKIKIQRAKTAYDNANIG